MTDLATEFRSCAFCRQTGRERELIKYSVRRYAHPICFTERHGVEALALLPSVELGKVPVSMPLSDGAVINGYRLFLRAQAREEMSKPEVQP